MINLQTIAIIFDVLQPSLAHAHYHEMNDLCHIAVTKKVENCNVLVTVMMKLVVRSQSWQGSHTHTVGEEDLRGPINPCLT